MTDGSLYFLIEYIDDLLKETFEVCKRGGVTEKTSEVPEPLCGSYERPEKSVAVKMHKTRFMAK